MTNDRELADEIERRLPLHSFVGAKLGLADEQWQQIIAALRRSQPEGEMVMGLRVIVNPGVPADEVWIGDAHGKRLGTIVNLATTEAEGREP